jgi:uncharacterized membrane protein YhiD involved in acid resistance
MNDITLNDLKNLEITLSYLDMIQALVVAAICAEIISIIYKKYARTIGNRESFSNIFIPLAITTTIVITIVKFSLALSLGLVGALSIVRFRAAIKEPEELVYLFLVIAVGLSCGAGQYMAAIILTIFAALVIFIQSRTKKKSIIQDIDILNISCQNKDVACITEIFKELNIDNAMLKMLSRSGNIVKMTYLLKELQNTQESESVLKKLEEIELDNFSYSMTQSTDLAL